MITERSNHETASAGTQKNTAIGNWYLDMVNNRLYWSDESYRIFGLSKKDWLPYYSTFYNAIHPDDRAAWTAHRDLFIKGTIPMNIEHRIVLPTGEIRYVHQSGERILDGNNRLTWLCGTIEDITHRRKLNKNLENLPPFARETSSPVIVIDMKGNITWVNKAFTRTFEYELREVAGTRPGTFLQGPETDPATIRYLRLKIEKQESFEAEVLSYSKSGQKFWMLVEGQPIFDKNGGCKGFSTIHHHITGRKLAQEKIQASEEEDRHLFHQNPTPMWIFDYETLHFIEVNDAAVHQYGYSVGEFRQMKITDIRPELRMEGKDATEGTLSKEMIKHSIWTHITKDGKAIFVDVIANEIEYRGRRAVLVLANDVTEKILARKRADEEMYVQQPVSMAAAVKTKTRERKKKPVRKLTGLYYILISPILAKWVRS